MLCTSYTLTPGPSPSPAEHLRDVFLCVTSPAVTEEWPGRWQSPHVRARDGAAAAGAASLPLPLLSSLAVPLASLLRSYTACATQDGCSFLQVLALGAHQTLSTEVKAMVAGAAMAALRARLLRLLHSGSGEEEKTKETLRRWCCRASRGGGGGAQPVTVPLTDVDTDVETWRVTWSPELLHTVVTHSRWTEELEGAATVLTVCACSGELRSSVEGGLRARLRGDVTSSSDGVAVAPLSKQETLSVQLTHLAAVSTHPVDVQRAVAVSCHLYAACLYPAQAHTEDATEAFQAVLRHPTEGDVDAARAPALWGRWQAALQGYHDSAAAAQRGVLLLLTRDVTAACGTSPLAPLTATEEDARTAVSTAQMAVVTDCGVSAEAVLAPVRVSTAGAYVNNVLLVQAWTGRGAVVHGCTPRTVEEVSGESTAVLAPARAALQWRQHLPGPAVVPPITGVTETLRIGATLRPTPLQYILYVLRRQLVVAVSNSAQVLLTGKRLARTHVCAPRGVVDQLQLQQQPLSAASLRAQALRCVKAQSLLRNLLKWHCPYPVPFSENDVRDAGTPCALPAAPMAELLWCLRLLAKLHLRAAALYGCAGDDAEQQRQLRQWRDQLQRWRSRRQSHKSSSSIATRGRWDSTVEEVVCHVPEPDWAVYVREVSAGLPTAP